MHSNQRRNTCHREVTTPSMLLTTSDRTRVVVSTNRRCQSTCKTDRVNTSLRQMLDLNYTLKRNSTTSPSCIT